MKTLYAIILFGICMTYHHANAQSSWKPYIVSVGVETGDALGAYMSVGQEGGWGGEFNFGVGKVNDGIGYVGLLATHDVFTQKQAKKSKFNVKFGGGFETKEIWVQSDDINYLSGQKVILQKNEYHIQIKLAIRYKRIETSIKYGASGASVAFGVILKKW